MDENRQSTAGQVARSSVTEISTRRRRFRRRVEEVQIESVDQQGSAVAFDCYDLSAVGVYLYSDLLLSCGEKLTLRLSLPSSPRPISLTGEVVRANTGDGLDDPAGMGVAFREMGREVRQELRKYVAGRFVRHAKVR